MERITKNLVLQALKNGFYSTGENHKIIIYTYWHPKEFVVDYDLEKDDYCLRNVNENGILGRTKFYLKDYNNTWLLELPERKLR